MNSCLGHKHLYCMYILAQDQNGLVRSNTKDLCFSQVSPGFHWGATLPSLMAMDAPRDAAQAHAEAVKVETWCRKEGIKTLAELAVYFTTFDEALSEAGRAVARSWQVARQSSEQGVAGLVRGLFAAEKQSRSHLRLRG